MQRPTCPDTSPSALLLRQTHAILSISTQPRLILFSRFILYVPAIFIAIFSSIAPQFSSERYGNFEFN
ncbi:hypothetical protein L1987_85517 [Smallanthus sonchifolius]|uniref:Uncharacterized protein n=1 Tax=Smallanthus sonchifolius TaxID=185202 RepID=A0ACB8XXT7_9ASTR|nr:hypothetical protein L1987_85517 [Smallanthus sonchifolius]